MTASASPSIPVAPTGKDRLILVTRPEPDNAHTQDLLASVLPKTGFATRAMPFFASKLLPWKLVNFSNIAAVALTSTNSVRALVACPQFSEINHLPAFTVGLKTAQIAAGAGFANVSHASGNVEDLARLIARANPSGNIFYPAATHRAKDLARALAGFEINTQTQEVYQMVPTEIAPDSTRNILATPELCILAYSRRAALRLSQLLPHALFQTEPHVICLSQNVAEPLHDHGFLQLRLADTPTEQAMMDLAQKWALSFTH